MRLLELFARSRAAGAVVATGAMLIGCFVGTAAGLSLPQNVVSQKGREFRPGEVTIKRGEVLRILNDDGDLRHHAYVDLDKFNFDFGDQEPGTVASIAFPVAGDFDVLCAIYPKMKLLVHVK